MLTLLGFSNKEKLKKFEKLMQIVKIKEENLYIFWSAWGSWISIKLKKKQKNKTMEGASS